MNSQTNAGFLTAIRYRQPFPCKIEPGGVTIERWKYLPWEVYMTPSVRYMTPSVRYITPSVKYMTPSVKYMTPSVGYMTPSVEYDTFREI